MKWKEISSLLLAFNICFILGELPSSEFIEFGIQLMGILHVCVQISMLTSYHTVHVHSFMDT